MTLPNNLLTEQTVLMSCLYQYDILEHAANTLELNDFYDFSHRYVFNILKEMLNKKIVVSLDNLLKELAIRKDVEAIKLAMTFYNESLDLQFLESKIEDLKIMGLHRNMINKCQSGMNYFQEKKSISQEECTEWVNNVSNMIYSSSKDESYRSIQDILDKFDPETGMSFLECLQKRQEDFKNGVPVEMGIPTHFREIDALFDGFKPGHLIVIGARPGVGKTTFMCNIVLNMILRSKSAVGIMSLEMENTEITEKIALMHSGIDSRDFKLGRIDGEDFQRLLMCSKEICNADVFIDHTAGININLLYSRAKHWKNAHGMKVLFIDYLQLIKGSGKINSKYEEITAISQTLKKIAKDLKICVVSLAQLNRESTKSEKPVVSDLRDSGAIEQDADAIFLLNDPRATDPHYDPECLEVYLAKNRFGGTGKIKLKFQKNLSKISNFEGFKPPEMSKEWNGLGK